MNKEASSSRRTYWYDDKHVVTAAEAIAMLNISAFELEQSVLENQISGYRILETKHEHDRTLYKCLESQPPTFSIERYGFASYWDGNKVVFKVDDIHSLRDIFENCSERHPSSWIRVLHHCQTNDTPDTSRLELSFVSKAELLRLWGVESEDLTFETSDGDDIHKDSTLESLKFLDEQPRIKVATDDLTRWEIESETKPLRQSTTRNDKEDICNGEYLSGMIEQLKSDNALLRQQLADIPLTGKQKRKSGTEYACAKKWEVHLCTAVKLAEYCITSKRSQPYTTTELTKIIYDMKLEPLSLSAMAAFRKALQPELINWGGRPPGVKTSKDG